MSTNKSISYLLCNKGIIVNLYKLLFLSSHFSFQPNKRVFHPPTFPSLQPNTHKGKLNIFHPPTFPSSHFSSPPTKRTLSLKTYNQRPLQVLRLENEEENCVRYRIMENFAIPLWLRLQSKASLLALLGFVKPSCV